MASQKSLFWKNNMNFGAIAGFGIIIYSIILYFLDIQQNVGLSFIIYAIQIAIIVIGTKYLRDKIMNGSISYGRALGSGTSISLFASVIVAFYMYVFFKFIDTEALEKMYSLIEDNMYQQGLPEEQITMAMEMTKKFTTPFSMAIGAIFSYVFYGFVFSLITSAFLKKKSNSYDAAMAEIEKELKEDNNNISQ
jgi:hypothetical protein